MVEKYLTEVKLSLKNFIDNLKNFPFSYKVIKGVFEIIFCVNGEDVKPQEAVDLIFLQLPELYHCQGAMDFVENICSLLAGSLNYLFITELDAAHFVLMIKSVIIQEIDKLKILTELHEVDIDKLGDINICSDKKDDDLINYLENMNLHK
jgi:hypothetical protein